ncbi:hypothetical protein PF005_g8809 [Phytophthora fragariae]|uniref:C2H2-type domain-containing protein n=1 Tax=Phytophthora fragariae TaxID=53985 RepID=A0A6A3YEV9_9STRA|nr:hypothetical protein PF003_g496 [Phytophthora fragariae]KAE8939179.1 hypothetical protein PF009_g10955 [Phytophthora fragariae]KAE9099864.1 hypothetical protein PF006_g23036 [Phytophthora fragariae]KAE9114318.1 hypothetical protein PF007_g10407 [Phytophthora fragariae]KAE9114462.1 hypothetical protein PF010_g9688 [Phytophthora fragariae]
MNAQPMHFTNLAFCSIPVQPMPMSGQNVLPMFSFQHQQFVQSVRCTDPSKLLFRKRVHVCPVRTCGKRFSTSGNLSRHKRMHGKIDPLSCPIDGCICVFPSANKLERHLKFHYGGDVKVYHVDACGRTFSTTGNLNRHMKKHHGGVTSPSAASPATTPTQKDEAKASTKNWSSCSTSGETDTESDAPTESWWSPSSVLDPGAASFGCVWNDDLLDTLASILDDGAEQINANDDAKKI